MSLPRWVFSSSICLSVLSTGCTFTSATSASWKPYREAPASPTRYWKPVSAAYARSTTAAPALPEQEAPFSLAELIDIALQNNTNTQVTWAQARTAAAQYGLSQSPAYPTIAGQFSYERSYTPSISAGSVNPTLIGSTSNTTLVNTFLSTWGPELLVSYTLLDFGQLRATTEAARYALYFADWTHNRMIQTVVQTITTDYYNYLYQKALLSSYEADVRNAQTTFDQASFALEVGVKDIADFLFAQTSLLRSQIQAASQKQLVQSSFATLLSNMGLAATAPIKVEELPETTPNEQILQGIDTLVGIAFKERSDLLAAEADLKSKEESLKAAKRRWWPTVTYALDFGRTYFSGGLHDNYDFTSTVAFNLPIFSGFSIENGIKIARAQKEQSMAALRQKRLNIIKEVSTSQYNVKVSYETLLLSDNLLQSASKQYDVAFGKYKAGTATILDVVAAQTALAGARASRASAFQSWYTSLANLNYAIGQWSIGRENPALKEMKP